MKNNDKAVRNVPFLVFAMIAIVVVVGLYFSRSACADDPPPAAVQAPVSSPAPVSASTQVHIVAKDEFLRLIAGKYEISWEAILFANEGFLQAKYEETCSGKSKGYTDNPKRRGTFCNNLRQRPHGNTLKPGWPLTIPVVTAPKTIGTVVEEIKGDRIAVVIDDTGSMSEDRRAVSEFYLAAVHDTSKRLTGVWLYADDHIRKYEAGDVVNFQARGGEERTFTALQAAATTRPDAIILVTDEEGIGWDWARVVSLPPVIAHCLPDRGTVLCRENLQKVAQATGGRYVEGLTK